MKTPLKYFVLASLVVVTTTGCGRKGLRDQLGANGETELPGLGSENNASGGASDTSPSFTVPEFTLGPGQSVGGFNPGAHVPANQPQFFGSLYTPNSGAVYLAPTNTLLRSFPSNANNGFVFDAAGLHLFGNAGGTSNRFGATHIFHLASNVNDFLRASKLYAGGKFVVGPANASRIGFTMRAEKDVTASGAHTFLNLDGNDDDKLACDLYRGSDGNVHARTHYSLGVSEWNKYVLPLSNSLPSNPVSAGNTEVLLECASIRHVSVMYVNQRFAGIASRLGPAGPDPRINPFFNNNYNPATANEGFGFGSKGTDNYVKSVAFANLDTVVDPPIFVERFQAAAGSNLAAAPGLNQPLFTVLGNPLVTSAPGRLVSSTPAVLTPSVAELSNANLDETDLTIEFELAGSAGYVGLGGRRMLSPSPNNFLHGYLARIVYSGGVATISLHRWNNDVLIETPDVAPVQIALGSNTSGLLRLRARNPYSPSTGYGASFNNERTVVEAVGLIGGTPFALTPFTHNIDAAEISFRHGKPAFLLGGNAAIKSFVVRVPDALAQ